MVSNGVFDERNENNNKIKTSNESRDAKILEINLIKYSVYDRPTTDQSPQMKQKLQNRLKQNFSRIFQILFPFCVLKIITNFCEFKIICANVTARMSKSF